MLPFDRYPNRGRTPLGKAKRTDNCRYGLGLELMRATGQRRCAYCGVSLVDNYQHWLTMVVDHVIPGREAARLNVSPEYIGDFINQVLACCGCNGLLNRHRVSEEPQAAWTLEEFLALRDRVFQDRSQRLAERRAKEAAFFDSKPWEQ